MRIISTSYSKTAEYTEPGLWLDRISFYTGILEELAKKHEVISIERINYEGEYEQNNVRYRFMRLRKKVVRFPFAMHRFIKKNKPDAVLVNGFIFPLQIIQLRLTLGKKAKIIVLHRAEKPFKGFKKYLQKLADKCVNAYLFASFEFGKEWMEKGIISQADKIKEVLQSSSVFYPAGKKESRDRLCVIGSPVYLWVGRLDKNKDPLTVVKAFIQFLHYHPAAKLYMIYQQEDLLNEITRLIIQEGQNRDSIILLGKKLHHELMDWYNSADFIISGSHYEGSGIAVVEGMSCGCIPVVTDIISFRKMTGPGKCGLLYEPGNDNALLSALLQTRNMDIEKESKRVLEQFKKELSFSSISVKIEEIILYS